MVRQLIYLISLESRLVIRHSRSKKIVLGSFAGGLGLILFILSWKEAKPLHKTINEISFFFLMNIFLSFFYMGYGQYNFSWNCNHFNFLSVNKISWNNFFLAKLNFLIVANIFLETIPIFYILFFESKTLLFYLICSILFNAGILSLTSLFFAVHNTQRIDISSTGVFANWQGLGKNQHLLFIPYVFAMVIAISIGICTNEIILTWYISAVIGLVTVLLTRFWLKWLIIIFKKNRYKIIEGFNNSK